jgi:hypothetical protein
MKKLTLILLLIVNVFSYDPSLSVDEEIEAAKEFQLKVPSSDTNSSADDEIVKDIIKDLKSGNPDVSVSSTNPYFEGGFVYTSSELVCPPLTVDRESSHFVMLEDISFQTGSVTCSVYQKPHSGSNQTQEWKNSNPFENLKKVYTSKFTNPLYIEKLKDIESTTVTDSILSAQAVANAELYREKLKHVKSALELKYNSTSDNQKYLDLADVVDGVLTSNTEIINIQDTMTTGNLVFNDGYFVNYLDEDHFAEARETKRELAEITKNLSEEFSFLPNFFEYNPKETEIDVSKSEIEKLFGSNLSMLLNFTSKYYEIFNDIFIMLVIGMAIIAIFVVIRNHKEYIHRDSKDQIKLGATAFSISTVVAPVLLIFTLTIDDMDLSQEIEDINGNLHYVPKSTIQSGINRLSDHTNSIADDAAYSIISSYIDTRYNEVGNNLPRIRMIVKTMKS